MKFFIDNQNFLRKEGHDVLVAKINVFAINNKELLVALNYHTDLIEACKKALTCASLDSSVRSFIETTLSEIKNFNKK